MKESDAIDWARRSLGALAEYIPQPYGYVIQGAGAALEGIVAFFRSGHDVEELLQRLQDNPPEKADVDLMNDPEVQDAIANAKKRKGR